MDGPSIPNNVYAFWFMFVCVRASWNLFFVFVPHLHARSLLNPHVACVSYLQRLVPHRVGCCLSLRCSRIYYFFQSPLRLATVVPPGRSAHFHLHIHYRRNIVSSATKWDNHLHRHSFIFFLSSVIISNYEANNCSTNRDIS